MKTQIYWLKSSAKSQLTVNFEGMELWVWNAIDVVWIIINLRLGLQSSWRLRGLSSTFKVQKWPTFDEFCLKIGQK